MSTLLPAVDPDGLLEFSVVYTDRSLNHVSKCFQQVMNDISSTLKGVYNAHSVAVVPGGGTYGMEAVARQFATGEKTMVLRNGWFSYRWTQILEAGQIPSSTKVIQARTVSDEFQAQYVPAPLEEVIAAIESEKPSVLFVPHVETSSGLILSDAYLAALGEAMHKVGGMLVVDCIASGCVWVDMKACGVDVLISAPQKGWTGTPCAGLVMMSKLARDRIDSTTSTSFACNLKSWLNIMETYEAGGHAYHATMPTDGLQHFRDVMFETKEFGFDRAKENQFELGRRVRELLESKGIKSVSAEGFQAPGVIVNFTDRADFQNTSRFAQEGLQVAAGVPLQCGEGEEFKTFRLGLFGLDKLKNIDRTVDQLVKALDAIL